MKLKTEKQQIEPAVKKLSKLANGKHNMDILNFIQLHGQDGQLTLTANDTLKTVSETIDYEGDEVATCIRAPKLAKAIQSFANGELEIVQDATKTQIKQGRSQIKLEALPANQFPDYDMPTEGWTDANIAATELSGAMKVVRHAMADNDVRPYLNGIYLCEGYAVATDGHRIARCPIDYQGHPVIIPSAAVPHIIDATGHAFSCESQLRVSDEVERIITKVIDSSYPDWQKLYQVEDTTTLTCNKGALEDAVKRALIADDKVRLHADAEGSLLHVSNDGAATELDAQANGPLKIALKAQYVADALASVGSDEIQIDVTSGQRRQFMINDDFLITELVE